MSSAWLTFSHLDQGESIRNMNGWLRRLKPLTSGSGFDKNIGFVFTNRCGKEFDTQFIGSTLHVQLNPFAQARYLSFDKEEVLTTRFELK